MCVSSTVRWPSPPISISHFPSADSVSHFSTHLLKPCSAFIKCLYTAPTQRFWTDFPRKLPKHPFSLLHTLRLLPLSLSVGERKVLPLCGVPSLFGLSLASCLPTLVTSVTPAVAYSLPHWILPLVCERWLLYPNGTFLPILLPV